MPNRPVSNAHQIARAHATVQFRHAKIAKIDPSAEIRGTNMEVRRLMIIIIEQNGHSENHCHGRHRAYLIVCTQSFRRIRSTHTAQWRRSSCATSSINHPGRRANQTPAPSGGQLIHCQFILRPLHQYGPPPDLRQTRGLLHVWQEPLIFISPSQTIRLQPNLSGVLEFRDRLGRYRKAIPRRGAEPAAAGFW